MVRAGDHWSFQISWNKKGTIDIWSWMRQRESDKDIVGLWKWHTSCSFCAYQTNGTRLGRDIWV
jgi:hypothetical protein